MKNEKGEGPSDLPIVFFVIFVFGIFLLNQALSVGATTCGKNEIFIPAIRKEIRSSAGTGVIYEPNFASNPALSTRTPKRAVSDQKGATKGFCFAK